MTHTPNFLRSIADYFSSGAASRPAISTLTFILPNKRSALFLKKYVRERCKGVTLMPRFMTIGTFLGIYSDYPAAQPRELLFVLYDAYRAVMSRRGRADDVRQFDSFVFWGDMMLNDFDEVDKSLVDARRYIPQPQECQGNTGRLPRRRPKRNHTPRMGREPPDGAYRRILAPRWQRRRLPPGREVRIPVGNTGRHIPRIQGGPQALPPRIGRDAIPHGVGERQELRHLRLYRRHALCVRRLQRPHRRRDRGVRAFPPRRGGIFLLGHRALSLFADAGTTTMPRPLLRLADLVRHFPMPDDYTVPGATPCRKSA